MRRLPSCVYEAAKEFEGIQDLIDMYSSETDEKEKELIYGDILDLMSDGARPEDMDKADVKDLFDLQMQAVNKGDKE